MATRWHDLWTAVERLQWLLLWCGQAMKTESRHLSATELSPSDYQRQHEIIAIAPAVRTNNSTFYSTAVTLVVAAFFALCTND